MTGSGTYVESSSMGGGVMPPRVTDDKNPLDWRPSMRERIMFVEGTDVSPRRAFEAFCRCDET